MPKRILQGIVTSNACDKTVTVEVKRLIRHPIFKKFVTRSKRFAAHDELNQYKVGEKVRIRECRPISKTKRWEIFDPSSTSLETVG